MRETNVLESKNEQYITKSHSQFKHHLTLTEIQTNLQKNFRVFFMVI